MKWRFVSCFCLLTFAGFLNAEEFFVKKTGDDANAGLTPQTAFQTIGKGLETIQAGDVLNIGPGEYTEAVSRTGLGNENVDTVIRAEIPGTVLLRGDVPLGNFTKVKGYKFVYVTNFSQKPYSVSEVDSLKLFTEAEYLDELEFLPGSYFYDANASKLYLSSADLQAPAAHHYTASVVPEHGFYLNSPIRVTVEGIATTGFNFNEALPLNVGGNKWGIVFEDATRSTIRQCTSYLNGGGICLMGTQSGGGNVVEKCTAYANYSRFNTEGGNIVDYHGGPNDLLSGNYVYRSMGYGQRFYVSERGNLLMKDSLGWGNNAGDFWIKGIRESAGPARAENIVSLSFAPARDFKRSLVGLSSHAKVDPNLPFDSIYLVDEKNLDHDAEFADPVHFDFRLQQTSRFRESGPEGSSRGPFPYKPEVYFLSTKGNDSADGLSVAGAWKTLARALPALKKGDTLYLQGGIYPENVSLTSEGISIQRRGKEAVILTGKWKIKDSKDVSLKRLVFNGEVETIGGAGLALDNCAFEKGGALRVSSVDGLRITHGVFTQTLKLSDCKQVHLAGNLYASTPAVEVSDPQEILYSDYNSYPSKSDVWKEGASMLTLEKLREQHDRYSVVATPEKKGVLAAAGPMGTSVGLYFEGDLEPLRVEGPFVHSVSDTTANIEWWTSLPAVTEFAWGSTPDCENKKVLDHHNYSAFSLTGLTPGQTYYYQITVKKPYPDLATERWVRLQSESPISGKFTTASEARKAQTWYVAKDGKNENNGQSRETAWRTLNHAAAKVGPGDTVLIAGGDYHETVWLRATGEKGKPIIFRSLPGERVNFDGVSRRLFAAFVGHGKHHQVFDSFYAVNLGRIGSHSQAILAVDQGGMFVLSYSDDVEINRCLKDGRGVGYSPGFITADRCENLLMSNCVAIGGFGRPAFLECNNLRVEHSVFFRNLINQLRIQNRSETARVTNNIFTDGLPVKIRAPIIDAGPATLEENNCFFPREPREKKTLMAGANLKKSGSILEDPKFAILAGVPLADDQGKPIYPIDRLPSGPVKLEDFMATNPTVQERGMGLQKLSR